MMLIITSVSGNALEWYDFALYGYFSSVLAQLFFPSEDKFISLILTFSVFASGFIVRPLGGIVFGQLGDKFGRKRALIISIASMTIPTALIGLLPSFNTIGVISPILLTLLRLLQSFAVAGELTGAGVFLSESAPIKKNGFFGSLIMSSTYLGLLIGSSMGVLMTIIFTEEQILNFAWRIPFLFSFVFGVGAFILRLKCPSSPLFLALASKQKTLKSPAKTCIKEHSLTLLYICLLCSSLAVLIYLIIGYFPAYIHLMKNLEFRETLTISFIVLFCLTLIVPILGSLSEQFNKKKMLIFTPVASILFAFPIFKLMAVGTITSILMSELLLVLILAPTASVILPFLSEQFPTNVRYTGTSIAYNTSMAIFGGTTPLISIYLTKVFVDPIAPAYYLVSVGVMTLIGILGLNGRINNYLNSSEGMIPNENLI